MVSRYFINTCRFFLLCFTVIWMSCEKNQRPVTMESHSGICDAAANLNTSDTVSSKGKGALLGTRFQSFDELKSFIQIEYLNNNAETDGAKEGNSSVHVRHCSQGREVISILESGINQDDIANAKYGGLAERFHVVLHSPFAVSNRKDLEKVYLLARVRPGLFGEGDVAFFNLAQTMVKHINTRELAFLAEKDSSEKGYLNTFNHMTAQAFTTSCFSEDLADFVADAHERYHHPELIHGKFTAEELNDLEEGPVDNYVDIINNEWGQEVGKQLGQKYRISRRTHWTPELMANYLNDLQQYFSWSFQIGFEPFRPHDEQVIKFSRKMNAVLSTKSFKAYYR